MQSQICQAMKHLNKTKLSIEYIFVWHQLLDENMCHIQICTLSNLCSMLINNCMQRKIKIMHYAITCTPSPHRWTWSNWYMVAIMVQLVMVLALFKPRCSSCHQCKSYRYILTLTPSFIVVPCQEAYSLAKFHLMVTFSMQYYLHQWVRPSMQYNTRHIRWNKISINKIKKTCTRSRKATNCQSPPTTTTLHTKTPPNKNKPLMLATLPAAQLLILSPPFSWFSPCHCSIRIIIRNVWYISKDCL